VKNRNNEIISTDAAFLHVVKPEVFSVHPSFLPAFTERVPLTAFEG
jgi:formyltetrahydrofolate hydrolase